MVYAVVVFLGGVKESGGGCYLCEYTQVLTNEPLVR